MLQFIFKIRHHHVTSGALSMSIFFCLGGVYKNILMVQRPSITGRALDDLLPQEKFGFLTPQHSEAILDSLELLIHGTNIIYEKL
jgi:hypothetical protein